jgi:ribosomal protein S12 methylthiotransferase accessory factor YcaO
MIIQARGCPFIIKSMMFRRSLFNNTPKHLALQSYIDEDTQGFSVNLSTTRLIKAAIGEYLERLAAFKYLRKSDSRHPIFKGVNILNGEVIDIPAKSILLNYHLPIFKNLDESERGVNFSDSCGTAAHIDSEKVIENAYLEFIERQSLIYTWLAKIPGRRINIENILFKKNKSLDRISIMKNSLDQFDFFDISISKGVKVILTLGYNENVFSAGLGADWEWEDAIDSSLNEFTMVFEGSIYNHYYMKEKEFSSNNVYVNYFYNMKPHEFSESYSFLFNSSIDLESKELAEQNNFEGVFDHIKWFSEEMGISLYIVQIPLPVTSTFAKVVKIVSPDAYPHMQTELFDPEDYLISKKIGNSIFPNKYKRIPFA